MKIWHSEAHQEHNNLSRAQNPHNMECPERVSIILAELQSRGLTNIVAPDTFSLEAILRVHDADYVTFLETVHQDWCAEGNSGELLPDYSHGAARGAVPRELYDRIIYYTLTAETTISAGTYSAARASADIALSGITEIYNGAPYGFALCRPPGHHAPFDQFGGFCYFNNAAVAAYHALKLGADRVAVLDIDYHHGNGTQTILEAEPNIFFASLHADTRYAYPYILGRSEEIGIGAAEGTMQNYPMPDYTGDDVWREALRSALERIRNYDPDIVLISLGVDTFIGDPISNFRLESDDYLHYGAMIAGLGKPTLFVMEGGYNLEYIGINVANVLEGFLQD